MLLHLRPKTDPSMLLTLLLSLFAWHASFCLSEPVSLPLYHNPTALSRRSIPLHKRSADPADVPWVVSAREHLRRKYGAEGRVNGRSLVRRQQELGDIEMANGFNDALYTAPITFGTPGVTYNLIADTGSSDMWVAGADCVSSGSCPPSAPTYDVVQSSTAKVTDTPFSIAYGSGNASGFMVTDTISMGGYSKNDVLFAVANASSSVLRNDLALSGIAGFGWASISTSDTTPFWELLAAGDTLDSNVFAFALTRASGTIAKSKPAPNMGSARMKMSRRQGMMGMPGLGSEIAASSGSQSASSGLLKTNAVYGGTLTLGGVNKTLFTGKINMVNLTNKGFWLVPMQGVTVNSAKANIGPVSNVAIDTGTSLIAAPAAACASIYGRIPGAQPSTNPQFQGYWEFPCDIGDVEIALQFNGVRYPMNPRDFNLGQVSDGKCLGSVFELDLAADNSTSTPSWIIGDAWLKNVYSVYQFDPPAVGFAQLSANWTAGNGGDDNAPTAAPTGNEAMAASGASLSTSVLGGRWTWVAGVLLLLAM